MSEFWNLRILGNDIYHLASWFFIYSFIGWIWETSFCSIRQKKFINRGFVFGPCITIYGGGAVLMLTFLSGVARNPALVFILGSLVASTLEYCTSYIMEKVYHARWWDYSKHKYNLQGRICLSVSIGWGFMSLGLFYLLRPMVTWFMGLYPQSLGQILIIIVFAVYCVDNVTSSIEAGKLSRKLGELESKVSELETRIAPAKAMLESASKAIGDDETKVMRAQQVLENERKTADSEMASRINELLDSKPVKDLVTVKEEWLKRQNATTARFAKAYPNLSRELDERLKVMTTFVDELRGKTPSPQ